MQSQQNEEKKIVSTFSFASFLHDMGSDMVYAVWPLFLTNVLGANMAVLGFIDGLGDALVSISQAISGYISDRIRRRKIFIWTGYLFGALAKVGYAFTTSWPWIIPFRVLDRAGKMRGSPRDAMIADVSTRDDRAKNFGILRAMDNLGAVFGIVIAIALINWIGYRELFLLAAIPSLLGTALVFFAIKEKPLEHITLYKGFAFKDIDKNFRLFIVLSAIFSLGSFSYSFLLIYAQKSGFSVGFVPVLYLIFNAFAFISSLPFGRLADHIGRKPVLFVSFILWALVSFALIARQSYWFVIAAFMLYGLHKGALEPVQKAFVSELAPSEYRSSGLGTFQLVTGLAALPASFLAGILWDSVSIASPFYFSLAASALAILLLCFVKEDRSRTVLER